MMHRTAKGETIAQTIDNLQAIMEADAIEIEKQAKQITLLQVKVRDLQARLIRRRVVK